MGKLNTNLLAILLYFVVSLLLHGYQRQVVRRRVHKKSLLARFDFDVLGANPQWCQLARNDGWLLYYLQHAAIRYSISSCSLPALVYQEAELFGPITDQQFHHYTK